MAKILLVEDDVELAERLSDWFETESYVFEAVYSGEDALQLLKSFDFDVILLDWNLPGISGIEVCKHYRAKGGQAPIIFLTGQGSIPARSEGLDSGADDYLVKPFDIRELAARIRSLLRRPQAFVADLTIGELKLQPATRTVWVGEANIVLMPKQSLLLEFLMRHPNQAFTGKALLNSVWPSDAAASEETVRTCVKTLRQQLATVGQKEFIKTQHGVGYMVSTLPG
jgi:two-component system response regulator QseB